MKRNARTRERSTPPRSRSLQRVGLNLLYLVPGEIGGMETYARRLIPALAAARREIEFVAFLNRDAFETLAPEAVESGVQPVRVETSGRSRTRRVAAEQLLLPGLLRRYGIDLLHSLGFTAPARSGVVNVVVIHDVIWARYPQNHSLFMRAGLRVLVPLAVRNAHRIIADSRDAASDIADVLRVDPARIDVVYPGGKPRGPATPVRALRSTLGLDRAPLVLTVSARLHHKNLPRLLRAFAGVRADPSPVLVVPGYSTSFDAHLEAEISELRLQQRVRVLGWIPDADLEGLYQAAACFVFPSLTEGFGLPVLEALERGVPVACSKASALPEVAGDAAWYFDPLRIEDIREAIEKLLGDGSLRARLSAAGKRRAQMFSWRRAAEETLGAYERAWAGVHGAARAGAAATNRARQ